MNQPGKDSSSFWWSRITSRILEKEPDGRKRFSLNYSGVMGRLLSVTKPQSRPTLSQRSIESIIWRDGWLYSPPPPKKGVFCVCGASLKVRSFRFFLFLFCYQEERGVYIKSSVILLCMPSQFHLFISLTFWLDLDPVSQRENRCRLFVKKGTVQLFDTLQKTLSPLHFFSPPSIDSVCI